jgi:hypothetical protein
MLAKPNGFSFLVIQKAMLFKIIRVLIASKTKVLNIKTLLF